jgi:uncharacterized protein YlxP (DUF503 family)
VVIGALTLTVHVPESRSLKDKRQVISSLLARIRRQFNVAAAEVDDQDTWQVATLGVVCVSSDRRHADEMCQKVLRWVEDDGEALLGVSRFELVNL